MFACVNPLNQTTGGHLDQDDADYDNNSHHRRNGSSSNTPTKEKGSYYSAFFKKRSAAHHRQSSSISSLESTEINSLRTMNNSSHNNSNTDSRPSSAMRTRKALSSAPYNPASDSKSAPTASPTVNKQQIQKSRFHFRSNSGNSVMFADEKTPAVATTTLPKTGNGSSQKAVVIPSETLPVPPPAVPPTRSSGAVQPTILKNNNSNVPVNSSQRLSSKNTIQPPTSNSSHFLPTLPEEADEDHDESDSYPYNNPKMIPNQELIIDQILTEGIKLKKKYKQLKVLYQSLEQEKAQEKSSFEQHFQQLVSQYENKLNELKTNQFLEWKSTQENMSLTIHSLETNVNFLQQEKNDLILSLQVAKQENNNLMKDKEKLLSSPSYRSRDELTNELREINLKEKELVEAREKMHHLQEELLLQQEKYDQMIDESRQREEAGLKDQEQMKTQIEETSRRNQIIQREYQDLQQSHSMLSRELQSTQELLKQLEKEKWKLFETLKKEQPQNYQKLQRTENQNRVHANNHLETLSPGREQSKLYFVC
jgi:hypothetical protein